MTESDPNAIHHKRRNKRRRRAAPTALPFRDIQPRQAASLLGFTSIEALWAYLRRNQRGDGTVDLGGGNIAFKRGARSWVIRVPVPAE